MGFRPAPTAFPTGPAGGVLGGTYPDPAFAVDMATQAELDAVIATIAALPSEGQTLIARPFRTGAYYQTPTGSSTTFVLTADRLTAVPFWVPATFTADRIAVEVTVVGAANSVVRLGIYNADGTEGLPSSLVLDAGTIDTSAGTGLKEITISQSLTKGLYYLAAAGQGSPATQPTVRGCTGSRQPIGTVSPAAFGTGSGYYKAAVSGAFPDPFGSLGTGAPGVPVIGLRKA